MDSHAKIQKHRVKYLLIININTIIVKLNNI